MTAILLCCGRLDFKLYCLFLQCSGRVQSKNGVDLVVVSIFYKSKTSGWSNGLADKDKNSSAFLSYHDRLVFTMLWTYPVQK